MTTDLIPEDWEYESQKELVYLQEEIKREVEKEIMRMIAEEERREAKISVIPPDQQENLQEDAEHKVLPF